MLETLRCSHIAGTWLRRRGRPSASGYVSRLSRDKHGEGEPLIWCTQLPYEELTGYKTRQHNLQRFERPIMRRHLAMAIAEELRRVLVRRSHPGCRIHQTDVDADGVGVGCARRERLATHFA